MFNVTFEVHGVNLTTLSEALPIVTEKLINRLATLAAFTMYTEAPYKTGLTANTITKQVNGLTAVIGPTTSYAPFIEFGTAPHIIQPRGSGCLAFTSKSGDMVFTRLVHHPGTRPNPFVQRTADIVSEGIPENFSDLWQETISENQQ